MKLSHIKSALLATSAATLCLITLSACDTGGGSSGGGGGYGGGGGGGGGPVTPTDPYKRAWFDVYGTKCINAGYPMSGCNFYADGSKIKSSADPYSASMTLYFDYWTYTDSYGTRRQYQGYAWLSSTGILYDDYGSALNEIDAEESQTADVISLASAKEKQVSKSVGKAFAQKYALAEEAGVSIAKTLQDWAVLGRDRARTDSDVADFSKRLYGVSLDQAKDAIIDAVKGKKETLVELNVDVAAHWGTSPETSKEILGKWYKEELSQLGVK